MNSNSERELLEFGGRKSGKKQVALRKSKRGEKRCKGECGICDPLPQFISARERYVQICFSLPCICKWPCLSNVALTINSLSLLHSFVTNNREYSGLGCQGCTCSSDELLVLFSSLADNCLDFAYGLAWEIRGAIVGCNLEDRCLQRKCGKEILIGSFHYARDV